MARKWEAAAARAAVLPMLSAAPGGGVHATDDGDTHLLYMYEVRDDKLFIFTKGAGLFFYVTVTSFQNRQRHLYRSHDDCIKCVWRHKHRVGLQ